MDESKRRLAQNEAVFRDVNERIEGVAATQGTDAHRYEFICECSNADCTFRVTLTLAEYEGVRESGVRFFVLPGHAMLEVEQVIEHRDGYDVVEKTGEAAEFVEAQNPR